jgi:hypothetical protein
MAIKQIKLQRFDGGIADEERDLSEGYFRYLENVNCGEQTRELKQIPIVSKTANLRSLDAVIEYGGTPYGIGVNYPADTKLCIWQMDTVTPVARTITAAHTWAYKTNPFLLEDGGYIFYDNIDHIGWLKISDWTNSGDWCDLTGGLKGGLKWKGKIWGWNGQKIYYIDNFPAGTLLAGTGNVPVEMITIPSDQTIVELLDYGELMAIVCTSTTGESKMFIWDGVTTTSFYDRVFIGRGNVRGASISNGVITVVINSLNNTDFRIKKYDGTGFTTSYYYRGRKNTGGTTKTYVISKVKEYKGYIYFICQGTRPNSAETDNVFMVRYGRKIGTQDNFCVYKDFDFIPTITSGVYADFTIYSDSYDNVTFFATVYQDTGAVMKEIRTGTIYSSQPGIIETGIFTGGDSHIQKRLVGVSTQFSAIPTNGQILLKYKADAETSWTTMATINTVGSLSQETVNVEATGANLPTFKEISFRLELLYATELTGLYIKYEEENNIL